MVVPIDTAYIKCEGQRDRSQVNGGNIVKVVGATSSEDFLVINDTQTVVFLINTNITNIKSPGNAEPILQGRPMPPQFLNWGGK